MTSPRRYLLRSPPHPQGVSEYDGDGFEHLVDLAERIAQLKWRWSLCLTGPPEKGVDQKNAFNHAVWSRLFQNGAPFEEDEEYRFARWMNEPWVPNGAAPMSENAGPPSRHLREGLYVVDRRSADGSEEPRPWFAVPGLERLVAERLPPFEAKDGSSGTSEAAGSDIWVEDKVVRAVVRAMLTRPLVLLAGISGSGKTQLARRLGLAWAQGKFGAGDAEDSAIANLEKGVITKDRDGWKIHDREPSASDEDRKRFGFIAVQSDWTDSSHLWGYHVPLPAEAEGFYGTEALRVFLSAGSHQEKPHFLLLDEMNLSRPEHYASDLLSAMEVQGSRVIHLHRAGAQVRLRDGNSAESKQTSMVPARIAWPKGLVVIGTVNVDETTFSFAPKVLDRAALLEFTEIDLEKAFGENQEFKAHGWWFKEIQRICRPYNLHLGYRAAREVLDTLAKSTNRAVVLDLQLCNKILPRIRGPRASVEPLLKELLPLAKCAGKEAALVPIEKSLNLRELYGGAPDNEKLKSMSHAERKIAEMLRRAYSVGFTSYFG